MNEFLRQLGLKRDLLNQVLTLTRNQTGFISADDTDALLTNISERQKLIDRIDAVQADLPDRETLRSNEECLALVAEVNGILAAIQKQDALNEKAALERMEDLRTQLRKVNDGRKTYGEYEGAGAGRLGGLYINKTK